MRIHRAYFVSIACLALVCCACSRPQPEAEALAPIDHVRLDSIMSTPAMVFQAALEMEGRDSAMAIGLYRQLASGDTATFWSGQARARIAFLEAAAIERDLIGKISGRWEWTWKGTNWGDIERPKKGVFERALEITEDGRVVFYENDSIVHKERYVMKADDVVGAREYLMQLSPSNELLSVHYSPSRLTLSEPHCVCGCLTNEYFRKWRRNS